MRKYLLSYMILSVSIGLLFFVFSACGSGPIGPPGSGSIYNNVKGNFNCLHGDEGGCIGRAGAKPVGGNAGTACVSNVLLMWQSGDMSLKKAAEQGGIKSIASVDYSNTNILGSVFSKNCLIVHGE